VRIVGEVLGRQRDRRASHRGERRVPEAAKVERGLRNQVGRVHAAKWRLINGERTKRET
jgi:hypothetical protein